MSRASEMAGKPDVRGILESALYVEDVARAVSFYVDHLDLAPLVHTGNFAALDAGRGTVLLIFERRSAAEGRPTEGGWIPPHDGSGSLHMAFAVADEAGLDRWADHLGRHGIKIESRVRWPGGGSSLYFRDPDGHSVELATADIWQAR